MNRAAVILVSPDCVCTYTLRARNGWPPGTRVASRLVYAAYAETESHYGKHDFLEHMDAALGADARNSRDQFRIPCAPSLAEGEVA